MPDKERYVQEMSRVLKPGGRIVIATWCEREEQPPFTPKVRRLAPSPSSALRAGLGSLFSPASLRPAPAL
jgi:SAM-dependent methyltransferase